MFFVSQRGFIQLLFDPDSGSQLQDLFSLVGASMENTPVLSVCHYGLSVLAAACLLGVYGLSR